MGKSAILSVRVVGDAKAGKQALDETSAAVDDLGKKSRDVSGKIEAVGDTAGRATTGLRDMADAVAMAGFPEFAAGMSVAATGLEAIDGAANLYRASSETLNGTIKKLTGTNKAATAATSAGTAATNRGKIATVAHKVATVAANAATKVFTIAQAALNAVLALNPITLIVIAITALIAGLVLAYNKCDKFREIVDKVWKILKNSLVVAFDAVSDAISTVVGWLQSAWDWVQKLIDKIKNLKLPDWVPGVNASLTVLTMPTNTGTRSATAAPVAATGGVTININSPVGDPHALARELRRLLRNDAARLGRPLGRDLALSS